MLAQLISTMARDAIARTVAAATTRSRAASRTALIVVVLALLGAIATAQPGGDGTDDATATRIDTYPDDEAFFAHLQAGSFSLTGRVTDGDGPIAAITTTLDDRWVVSAGAERATFWSLEPQPSAPARIGAIDRAAADDRGGVRDLWSSDRALVVLSDTGTVTAYSVYLQQRAAEATSFAQIEPDDDVDRAEAIAVTPNGELLLVGTPAGAIRMFRLVLPGTLNAQPGAHFLGELPLQGEQAVSALAMGPGGRFAAAGTIDGQIHLIEIVRFEEESSPAPPEFDLIERQSIDAHDAPVAAMAFAAGGSPTDGMMISHAAASSHVTVWQVQEGVGDTGYVAATLVRALAAPCLPRVATAALSASGERLAIAGDDGRVTLWKVRIGSGGILGVERIAGIAAEPPVTTLRFGTAATERLYVGRANGDVELLELVDPRTRPPTPRRIAQFPDAGRGTHQVEFAPDGRTMLVNNRLWRWGDDDAKPREIASIATYGQVSAIAFTADGRFALAGYSAGGALPTLWRINEPGSANAVTAHTFGGWAHGPQYSVAISPDERWAVLCMQRSSELYRLRLPAVDEEDSTAAILVAEIANTANPAGAAFTADSDELILCHDRALYRYALGLADIDIGVDPIPSGYLGVSLEEVTGGHGVRVTSVGAGSAADRAGIQVGDVIRRVEGRTVHSVTMLVQVIMYRAAGDPLALDLERDGDWWQADVTLGEHQVLEATPRLPHADPDGWFGAVTGDDESQLVIERIEPGSPAATAGLQVGDVIVEFDGWPIAGLNTLNFEHGVRANWIPGQQVSIGVTRNGQRVDVSVTITEHPTRLRRGITDGAPILYRRVRLGDAALASFSHGGTRVLYVDNAGAADAVTRLGAIDWSDSPTASTLRELATLPVPQGDSRSTHKQVALSGDGRWALTENWRRQVQLWSFDGAGIPGDPLDARELMTLSGFDSKRYADTVALSADGSYLIAARRDQQVELLEVPFGRRRVRVGDMLIRWDRAIEPSHVPQRLHGSVRLVAPTTDDAMTVAITIRNDSDAPVHQVRAEISPRGEDRSEIAAAVAGFVGRALFFGLIEPGTEVTRVITLPPTHAAAGDEDGDVDRPYAYSVTYRDQWRQAGGGFELLNPDRD